MRRETLRVDHFEAIYAARPDPWHYATSAYEQAKYAVTLAALPRARYQRGLEIGCAQGVFTAALAQRCDTLLAIEPVDAALAEARRRNADKGWVRFARMAVPEDWPDERFDLVVISEVIDYLGADDVEALSRRVERSLDQGGDAILVHWVGKKSGPPSGREASDLFIRAADRRFTLLRADRNRDYRMDLLRRM